MSTEAVSIAREGAVAPVSAVERVQTLDVLRGISLFGILMVNILDYAPAPQSVADRLTVQVIDVVAEGSFYPLFSLLFGVGFAVFLDRAAARGSNGVMLYLRRLAGLLLIAMLQIILLEDRNILVRYAFLGVPLLLFWRASTRVCLGAAILCFGLAVARAPISRALADGATRDPVVAVSPREIGVADQTPRQAREAELQRVAGTHSFLSFAAFRARWQVPAQLSRSINLRRNPTLFHILGMFLLGVSAWRSGLFSRPSEYRRLLIHALMWGGLFGVAGNLAVSLGSDGGPVAPLAGWPGLIATVALLANTALTFCYIAAIVLLLSTAGDAWRRRVMPFALIGRMGLTNYLWQSVAMSLLFLPYGLRLRGTYATWVYPLIGVIIFLSHLPLTAVWLRRYRFGPVEWLWRGATYGRLPPLRLTPETSTASAPAGQSTAYCER